MVITSDFKRALFSVRGASLIISKIFEVISLGAVGVRLERESDGQKVVWQTHFMYS